MAEQTTTPTDNKAKASANGATSWTQTPQGRKTLSENAKAAHAAKPRSTRPVTEDKIKRLNELLTGGATVKEAAKLIGMGYSTAQRYSRASTKAAIGKKSSKAHGKKAVGPRGPLSPEKKKALMKLLPKLGTKLKAQEIADRVGCHLTSVYFYRNKMLAEAPSPAAGAAPAPGRSQLSLIDYADLKDVYQTLWRDCFADDVEPTNAEIKLTRIWRRIR